MKKMTKRITFFNILIFLIVILWLLWGDREMQVITDIPIWSWGGATEQYNRIDETLKDSKYWLRYDTGEIMSGWYKIEVEYQSTMPNAVISFHTNTGVNILIANSDVLNPKKNNYQKNIYLLEKADNVNISIDRAEEGMIELKSIKVMRQKGLSVLSGMLICVVLLGIIDLLLSLCYRCYIRYGMDKKVLAWNCVFSLLFAICIVIGKHVVFEGLVTQAKTDSVYMTGLATTDFLLGVYVWGVSALLISLIYYIIRFYNIFLTPHREKKMEGWKYVVLGGLILLGWLPYCLSMYPGIVGGDSISSISQIVESGRATNNHHPIVYTYFVGLFLKIGQSWGDYNLGVFLYTLVQMLIMDYTICRVIHFMYQKSIKCIWIILAVLFYVLVPIFPLYAISMWKDPIYSCFLLLLSITLYYVAEQKYIGWRHAIKLCGLLMGCAFFRNNGIYVVFATGLGMAFIFRKQLGKVFFTFGSVMLVYLATVNLYGKVGVETDGLVESISIPLQQIAATITNGEELNQKEEKVWLTLLSEEKWKEDYVCCLVDPIKWDKDFDIQYLENNRIDFFVTWFKGIFRHPISYIKAYLLQTQGFWKVGVQQLYGYMELGVVDNRYGIVSTDLIKMKLGFSVIPILERMYKIVMHSGTLFWSVMFAFLMACAFNRRKSIAYFPALLNWLFVMLATPAAYSLRYVFIFALGLPMYLAIAVVKEKEEANMVKKVAAFDERRI